MGTQEDNYARTAHNKLNREDARQAKFARGKEKKRLKKWQGMTDAEKLNKDKKERENG